MISSPIPPSGHVPPAFLQILLELESGVSKTIASEKAAAKKMPPVKAKALNGMRQVLKKKMKEFEAVLTIYNEVSTRFRPELAVVLTSCRILLRLPLRMSPPMLCQL